MTHTRIARCIAIGLVFPLVLSACDTAENDHLTLEDAVEAHVEAAGGRAALESLGVIERQGRFSLLHNGDEYAGSYRTCVHYPEKVAIAVDAGPVQVHQILGDHGALVCVADFTACAAADKDVETELQETARMANREQLYMEFPADYDVAESDDGLQYRYELDGVTRGIAFDKRTGLIRSIRNDTKVRELGDWRSIGSVMLPFSIRDEDAAGDVVTISLSDAVSADAPSSWCRAAFAIDVR